LVPHRPLPHPEPRAPLHCGSKGAWRAAAALLGLAALGAWTAWACVENFPDWLLGGEALVTKGPTANFYAEVTRLYPAGSGDQHAVVDAGDVYDPFTQTARVDVEELADALSAANLPADRRQALVAAYGRLRATLPPDQMQPLHGTVDRELDEERRQHWAAAHPAAGDAAPGSPRSPGAEVSPAGPAAQPSRELPGPPGATAGEAAPAAAPPTVPEGLPAEFALYVRGAVAYRAGEYADAGALWEKLLALPEAERRHRSTWAAFMLAKAALAHLPGNPDQAEEAVRRCRQTRDLAAHAFSDRLGLAASSLGWEARAEASREHYARALELYAAQARSGDPTALCSLRLTCRAAHAAGGEALAAVARERVARDAMTSWVLGQPIDTPSDPGPGPVPPEAIAQSWLQALRAAGIEHADGADRLAWVAYRAGNFAAAADWLGRAGTGSSLARWLRARLLLHDGKLAEAEALLVEIGKLPPADGLVDTAPGGGPGLLSHPADDPYLASPGRALGEAGVIALSRGRFVPALDDLLRGGYWLDAAYVAERVLSTAELRAYVDRTWPAPAAAGGIAPPAPAGPGLTAESPGARLAPHLRYLLARRLVRDGRAAAARPYLPDELRPRLDQLLATTAAAANPARPAAERAADLFRAACLTRHQGLELRGTELQPDWEIYAGELTIDTFPGDRGKNPHLHPTRNELDRLRRHPPKPWKRFHYRYNGAALARAAADLLPAGSAARAGMLATAGDWLALQDPAAAQPFYQSLVRCCAQTDLGRAAAARGWLPPKADTCEPDTEAVTPPAH
jgi:tetratricopeptide (TPR) repeat protein